MPFSTQSDLCVLRVLGGKSTEHGISFFTTESTEGTERRSDIGMSKRNRGSLVAKFAITKQSDASLLAEIKGML